MRILDSLACEPFYNFHRLRDFEETFDPVWESGHLVASAMSSGARFLP